MISSKGPCLTWPSLQDGSLFAKQSDESQNHIFIHRSSARKYRDRNLITFSWLLSLPRDVKDILTFVLPSHPFKDVKPLLCVHINRTFVWVKRVLFWTKSTILKCSLILLSTMLSLGINCIAPLLHIVMLLFYPVRKTFYKHHGLSILFVNFIHQLV